MKYIIFLLFTVTVVFAKPSMKTAIEDKSIYGVESKTEENNIQKKVEIKEPFKNDIIKSPIMQKKDNLEGESYNSMQLPKKEQISAHEKFKKEYTGGSKIKSSYNQKIFNTLEKTIPAGASHSSGGGD